eukprot:10067513-Ditylum_brightwellii.AAC.1
MRWRTKRRSDEASKHHAALLLAYLKKPCPPFTASFKHCRQWGEAGIAVSCPKKTINVVLMNEQLHQM